MPESDKVAHETGTIIVSGDSCRRRAKATESIKAEADSRQITFSAAMATLGLTSTRGILTEKTVNTLGNSGQPPQLVKEIPWPPKLADARIRTTNKRRIDEVDTPELAVTHLRPRIESVQDYYGIQILEDADGPSHKASWSSEMFESNTHCCLQNPAPSSINMSLPTISHHSSEINDTDSQKSCMSSLINFDPEDETIGSQQTAATEVTQPERSVARAVST